MPFMDKLVAPIAVEVIGEHKLRVTFKDGLVGDIDFTGRHWRGVSEPLADPAFFAQAAASTPRYAPSHGPTASTWRPRRCTNGPCGTLAYRHSSPASWRRRGSRAL